MGSSMKVKCAECGYNKEYFTGYGFSAYSNLTGKVLTNFAVKNKLSDEEVKIIKDIPNDEKRTAIEDSQLFYCDCDSKIIQKRFTEINHPDFLADDDFDQPARPAFVQWTKHIFTVDHKNIMVGNLVCLKCHKVLKFADDKRKYVCPKCSMKTTLSLEQGDILWD